MTLGNLAALVADEHEAAARLLVDRARRLRAPRAVVVFARGRRATPCCFYLAIYYLMNLGAFCVVMLVANATGREDIDGYRGLAWRGGALPAVALAIFLFSLAGLPPLAGFIGKFYVFAAGIQGELYVLVRDRRAEQRRVALLLRARREDDVPRPAGGRRPAGRLPGSRDLGVGRRAVARDDVPRACSFGWLLRSVADAGRVFRGLTASARLASRRARRASSTSSRRRSGISRTSRCGRCACCARSTWSRRRTRGGRACCCARHGIETPVVSYYDAVERRRAPELVARLAAGASVALVSDAGTPGIADPGYHLVRGAIAAGIRGGAGPGRVGGDGAGVGGGAAGRIASPSRGSCRARAAARAARLRALAARAARAGVPRGGAPAGGVPRRRARGARRSRGGDRPRADEGPRGDAPRTR